jgi:uncharacterized membrane protein
MTNTLLGVFSNRYNAEQAVAELETNGFAPKDISLVMKNQHGQTVHHTGSNLAEGAATGVATGSVVGGLAGLLLGVGAITLPGLGALLIAGPLAAALGLTGIAATTVSGALTGAVAGVLVGALVGLGIPEDEAKEYESKIRDGGILVAVPVLMEEEGKVRKIFRDFGADMIRIISTSDREREVYNQNYHGYEPRQDYGQAYYSDVRQRDYDHNLDDIAAHPRPSFWQKLRDLFR